MLQYKLCILFTVTSIFGFLGFLITALVMREKQAEWLIWFKLTAIFFMLSILSCVFLIKFVQSKYYKEIVRLSRESHWKRYKNKNKITQYILKCDTSNLEIVFQNTLIGFEYEKLKQGILFYKNIKNIYNKREEAFDVFYVFYDGHMNSADCGSEEIAILKYKKTIIDFLHNKGNKANFVNCVIVFQHNSMSEDVANFYNNFIGHWEADLDNGKFIRNNSFTYCGIDNSTKKVYFYKSLKSDSGMEVDLSYMIIRDLQLEKQYNYKQNL